MSGLIPNGASHNAMVSCYFFYPDGRVLDKANNTFRYGN